ADRSGRESRVEQLRLKGAQLVRYHVGNAVDPIVVDELPRPGSGEVAGVASKRGRAAVASPSVTQEGADSVVPGPAAGRHRGQRQRLPVKGLAPGADGCLGHGPER